MVNKSAVCNVPQLVSTEDGTIVVPTFNWSSFFATHFKKVSGIKKYHHFIFDSSQPGIVTMKEHSDCEPHSMSLLKNN